MAAATVSRRPMACKPVWVAPELRLAAAVAAIDHNPQNRPILGPGAPILPPEHLAAMTGRTWLPGTTLTVGFMEQVAADLRDLILSLANRWNTPRNPAWPGANIWFVYSQTDPVIRVTRDGSEYYSYIGTDNKMIPAGQHTMMLGGFTMSTRMEELLRVGPHEFGHALGFIHEHQRCEYKELFDEQGTIADYAELYDWPESMTRQQILTFRSPSEYTASPFDNDASIMRYDFRARCMKSRQPLLGGSDIDEEDYRYSASIYTGLAGPTGPVIVQPPPLPPKPDSGAVPLALGGALAVDATQPVRFAVEVPANSNLRLALRATDQGGWQGWLATVLNWTLVFHSAQGRDTTVSLRGGQGTLGIDAGRYEFDVGYPLPISPSAVQAQAWQVTAGMMAATGAPLVGHVAAGVP